MTNLISKISLPQFVLFAPPLIRFLACKLPRSFSPSPLFFQIAIKMNYQNEIKQKL
jgi:hypothetical protein